VQYVIAADSQSAGKKTEIVKIYNRTRIAYLAGRLITGKHIASLYDFNSLSNIEIASLPDADCLTEFDCRHKNYAAVTPGRYKYWFCCKKDHAIDLSIKGNTFMGKITGSTAYFIGNVRGDLIHIYDHEDSLHLNYRISGCMIEHESSNSCNSCWMATQ
jgi:hypothetical protein